MDYTPGSTLRRIISNEFMQPEHEPFRNWYFKEYSPKQLDKIKDVYYSYLEKYQTLEWFSDWFLKFKKPLISILENHFITWQKIDGSKVNSVHPPVMDLGIKTSDNRVMKVTPFIDPEKKADTSTLTTQKNFTNLNLGTISKQLDRIENSIQEKSEPITSKDKAESSKQGSLKNHKIESIDLKPPMGISNFKTERNLDKEFMEAVMENFKINVLNDNVLNNDLSNMISENFQDNIEFGKLNKLYRHPKKVFRNKKPFREKNELQNLEIDKGLCIQLSKILINLDSENTGKVSSSEDELNHLNNDYSSSS